MTATCMRNSKRVLPLASATLEVLTCIVGGARDGQGLAQAMGKLSKHGVEQWEFSSCVPVLVMLNL